MTVLARVEGRVFADYHQFYVVDGGSWAARSPDTDTSNPEFWSAEAFGRGLAVLPAVLGIGTASYGTVPVAVEVGDGRPFLEVGGLRSRGRSVAQPGVRLGAGHREHSARGLDRERARCVLVPGGGVLVEARPRCRIRRGGRSIRSVDVARATRSTGGRQTVYIRRTPQPRRSGRVFVDRPSFTRRRESAASSAGCIRCIPEDHDAGALPQHRPACGTRTQGARRPPRRQERCARLVQILSRS